jgi:poly(3-hydroxybutyrate) depolymerase
MTRTPNAPRLRLDFSFRLAIPVFVALLVCGSAPIARAQTIEDSIAPGKNFDKAQFRLWYPHDAGKLRAVLVLVPGSNGDGRSMADDSTWQAFASRNKLAIVACRFTDKPHEQSFIEDYVNVSQGSGQALLDALTHLAARAQHPEIASAPLLFWGMSAGGEFNYEFAAWKPERVIAFVVNKGGIYYSALTSRATRQVPALLFIGGKDLDSRVNTITGLFAVNRRGGALWALAEEPGVGHVVGRSRDMSIIFFDDVLPLRLDESSSMLKPMAEASGYIGELKTKRTEAVADMTPTPYLTAWFPTARVARAWQAMATEKPFE